MTRSLEKPRPRLLDKTAAKATRDAIDRAENAKVRARSQGWCEVREQWGATMFKQCRRRAGHIHHLRSGIGVRNHGESILSSCKLHVCEQHHSEIHGHVLKPVSEETRHDAATVIYERYK